MRIKASLLAAVLLSAVAGASGLGCAAWAASLPLQPSAPIKMLPPSSGPVKLTAIPKDAAIIFWSTRDVPSASVMGPSHLYVMTRDGKSVTRITSKPDIYEHAAVSFSRRYVVVTRYVAQGSLASQVWVLDLQNQTETRLVPSFYSAGNGGVDWSPNGFIYFAAQRVQGADQNIYKIKPDGSGFSQITHLVQEPQSRPPESGMVGDLSVSEDGSMIAVNHFRAIPYEGSFIGKPQILIMNSDGTNIRPVTDGGNVTGTDKSGTPIGDYDPEISPDNKYVVFSRQDIMFNNFPKTINTAHDLWIAPTDGSAPARMVTKPGPVTIVPDWHEGKLLATEYNEKENYVGLVMFNPDGSDKTHLEHFANIWNGGRHGKFINAKSDKFQSPNQN